MIRSETALRPIPAWMRTLWVVSEITEVVMKAFTATVALAAAMIASVTASATQHHHIEGSAAAIRSVITGKVCLGKDSLTFGENIQGLGGTFERSGRPVGTYSVGYGTILVRRGQELHGHVVSVSPENHMLYFSTETSQCDSGPGATKPASTIGGAAK